MDDNRQH